MDPKRELPRVAEFAASLQVRQRGSGQSNRPSWVRRLGRIGSYRSNRRNPRCDLRSSEWSTTCREHRRRGERPCSKLKPKRLLTLSYRRQESAGAQAQEGEFVEEQISNPRAAQYQARVTGQPGQAYELNGVRFDGAASDTGELLEAKGPGYANLLTEKFAGSVIDKLLAQAARQVERLEEGRSFGISQNKKQQMQ